LGKLVFATRLNFGKATLRWLLDQASADRTREEAQAEADEALEQSTNEPRPTAADVYKFTYAPSKVDPIYPDDYTGLP